MHFPVIKHLERLGLLAVPGLVFSLTAHAGLYTYDSGAINLTIPDADINGVQSSHTFSGLYDRYITAVTVTLNLSGGWNGDLYAFLSHDGVLVPLLDRIGVWSENPLGAGGAGMTVTLSDLGTFNIHTAGDDFLNGTWKPDGQNVDPVSPPGDFNANGGLTTLNGTFQGRDPNGTWTLFFSDVVSGGGTGPSVLNSWSLNISAVPEPVNVALVVFGFCIAGGSFGRWVWARVRQRGD